MIAHNDTTAIRSVEQLIKNERRQLSSASLQARPDAKLRNEFEKLRQKRGVARS